MGDSFFVGVGLKSSRSAQTIAELWNKGRGREAVVLGEIDVV